jgi:hypothetical protein
VPVAEARRRLGMPEAGMAREFYPEITLDPTMAAAIRAEWKGFGVMR